MLFKKYYFGLKPEYLQGNKPDLEFRFGKSLPLIL